MKTKDNLMASIFKSSSKDSLKGQLLVATPLMEGSFEHAVILMLEHNTEGAMGLVINRPVPDIRYEDLYEQLKLEDATSHHHAPVFFGGPVEVSRGFVMFTNNKNAAYNDSIDVGEITVTSSLQVLRDIANGAAPAEHRIILGYAGWSAGQLEAEMEENAWITVPASHDILFTEDHHLSWQRAATAAGISWERLSTTVGHA